MDFFDGWDMGFERKFGKDKIGREKIRQLTEVLDTKDLPDVEKAIGEFVDLDSFYTFWAKRQADQRSSHSFQNQRSRIRTLRSKPVGSLEVFHC